MKLLFTAAILGAIAGVLTALWLLGYHIVWPPTEDQLYGCTIEQEAPNGECK